MKDDDIALTIHAASYVNGFLDAFNAATNDVVTFKKSFQEGSPEHALLARVVDALISHNKTWKEGFGPEQEKSPSGHEGSQP